MTSVFPRFAGYAGASDLTFSEPSIDLLVEKAEAVFLALPHGVAAEFAVPLAERGVTVIDLSADFRLNDAGVYQEFYGAEHPSPEWLAKAVYGLPEVRRNAIADATLIASPGCYPTSILLPTIPLLEAGLIDPADHRRLAQRRQRCGPQRLPALPVRRVQREPAALRRAQAPAPLGDRTGTQLGQRLAGDRAVYPCTSSR